MDNKPLIGSPEAVRVTEADSLYSGRPEGKSSSQCVASFRLNLRPGASASAEEMIP